MFLICDDIDLPIKDVIENLSPFYGQNTGWDACSLILYEHHDAPVMYGLSTSIESVIGFQKTADILNPKKTTEILTQCWVDFVSYQLNSLVPRGLRDILSDLYIDQGGSSSGIEFYNRLNALICPKLNLNWEDMIRLNLASTTVDLIKKSHTSVKRLTKLKNLLANFCSLPDYASLEEIEKSDLSLAEKTYAMFILLEKLRSSNDIEDFIHKTSADSSFFSTTLQKIISVNESAISKIVAELENLDQIDNAG